MPAPAPVKAFEYFDGVNQVFADPWPLYRDLMIRTGGQPNALARRVRAVQPDTADTQLILDGLEAARELEALIRDLFKMQPFNAPTGEGAQWPHCFAVFEQFAVFMTDLKKKAETTPTSTPSSESPPTSPQVTATGSA